MKTNRANIFYTTQQGKTLHLLLQQLHIPNRVVQRPLAHPLKITTNMLRVQLGPGQRIAWNHVESEEPNVGVALDVEAQHFDAMVYTCVSQAISITRLGMRLPVCA